MSPAAAAAVFPPAATVTTTATSRRKRQRASLNRAAAASPAIHLLREDGPDIDASAAAVAAAAVAGQEQLLQVQAGAETGGLDRVQSGEEGPQGRRVRRRSRRGGGEQRGGLMRPEEQSAREEVRVSGLWCMVWAFSWMASTSSGMCSSKDWYMYRIVQQLAYCLDKCMYKDCSRAHTVAAAFLRVSRRRRGRAGQVLS